MADLLSASATWGACLTLGCFCLFSALQKKTGLPFLNPLLLSAAAIIALLAGFEIPYETYRETTSTLSWLLLPATVSLAIPLYEQWDRLRKNAPALLFGMLAGTVVSLASIVVLAKYFSLKKAYAVSLLPKSVTTAIGTDVSLELGGIPSLTVVVIILTGIVGNLLAPALCRLFGLKSAEARGVAVGTCSHAIGTTKALQMGETEGAMSSLAIAVSGILTAVLAPLAAALL